MKILKRKIPLILPLLFIIIGLYLGYSIFEKNDKLPSQWTITDNTNINRPKYASTESLVNEIKSVNKIVPLEIELSEEIVVNDSWGTLGLFEKIKTIKFYANCSYFIDLSAIDTSNVKTSSSSINISIPKPQVLSVNILGEKTLYNEPELGLFRFGDITLTSEEYGVIYNDISKVFNDKMMSDELYKQALDASKIAMEDLLKDLLNNDAQINITFI